MPKAIVYTSNSGFTARYANLLGEKLSLPVYTLSKSKSKLAKGDEIVYLGWLMAGIVKGLNKTKKYSVKAICGVGMAPATQEERERIAKQNKLSIDTFFLLQGGFDINKLHGVYHFMMSLMVKALSKGIGEKIENGTASETDKQMYDMALNGGDCVSEDALSPVIELLSK